MDNNNKKKTCSSTMDNSSLLISNCHIGPSSLVAKKSNASMDNPKKSIVLDLMKERAEDLELLNLIVEHQKQKGIDNKNEGFKVLFHKKHTGIEMIPEEDEEKHQSKSKIIYKGKHMNSIINNQLSEGRCKVKRKNIRHRQLESLPNNSNKEILRSYGAEQYIQTKLNLEDEKMEIEKLLSQKNKNTIKGVSSITKLYQIENPFNLFKRQSMIYIIN